MQEEALVCLMELGADIFVLELGANARSNDGQAQYLVERVLIGVGLGFVDHKVKAAQIAERAQSGATPGPLHHLVCAASKEGMP